MLGRWFSKASKSTALGEEAKRVLGKKSGETISMEEIRQALVESIDFIKVQEYIDNKQSLDLNDILSKSATDDQKQLVSAFFAQIEKAAGAVGITDRAKKDLYLRTFVHHFATHSGDIKSSQTEVTSIETKLAGAQSNYNRLRKDLDALNVEIEAKRKEYTDKYTGKIHPAAKAVLGTAQDALLDELRKLAGIGVISSFNESDIANARQILTTQAEELQNKQTNPASYPGNLTDEALAKLHGEREAMIQRITALEEAINNYNDAAKTVTLDVSDTQKHLFEVWTKIEETNFSLEEELSSLTTAVSDKQKEIDDISASIAKLVALVTEAENSLNALQVATLPDVDAISNAQKALKDLQDQKAQAEADALAADVALTALNDEVIAKTTTFNSSQAEHEKVSQKLAFINKRDALSTALLDSETTIDNSTDLITKAQHTLSKIRDEELVAGNNLKTHDTARGNYDTDSQALTDSKAKLAKLTMLEGEYKKAKADFELADNANALHKEIEAYDPALNSLKSQISATEYEELAKRLDATNNYIKACESAQTEDSDSNPYQGSLDLISLIDGVDSPSKKTLTEHWIYKKYLEAANEAPATSDAAKPNPAMPDKTNPVDSKVTVDSSKPKIAKTEEEIKANIEDTTKWFTSLAKDPKNDIEVIETRGVVQYLLTHGSDTSRFNYNPKNDCLTVPGDDKWAIEKAIQKMKGSSDAVFATGISSQQELIAVAKACEKLDVQLVFKTQAERDSVTKLAGSDSTLNALLIKVQEKRKRVTLGAATAEEAVAGDAAAQANKKAQTVDGVVRSGTGIFGSTTNKVKIPTDVATNVSDSAAANPADASIKPDQASGASLTN